MGVPPNGISHLRALTPPRALWIPRGSSRQNLTIKKAPGKTPGLCCLIRRRPTLPHRCQCSTIGAGGLNFRVRDGNGCDPSARATENSRCQTRQRRRASKISDRVNFMVKPHDRLVLVSFTCHRASTSSLSPGGLPGVFSTLAGRDI